MSIYGLLQTCTSGVFPCRYDSAAIFTGNMLCIPSQEDHAIPTTSTSSSRSAMPIPAEFCCGITHRLMEDPVILVESGDSYERGSIEEKLACDSIINGKWFRNVCYVCQALKYQ